MEYNELFEKIIDIYEESITNTSLFNDEEERLDDLKKLFDVVIDLINTLSALPSFEDETKMLNLIKDPIGIDNKIIKIINELLEVIKIFPDKKEYEKMLKKIYSEYSIINIDNEWYVYKKGNSKRSEVVEFKKKPLFM